MLLQTVKFSQNCHPSLHNNLLSPSDLALEILDEEKVSLFSNLQGVFENLKISNKLQQFTTQLL